MAAGADAAQGLASLGVARTFSSKGPGNRYVRYGAGDRVFEEGNLPHAGLHGAAPDHRIPSSHCAATRILVAKPGTNGR